MWKVASFELVFLGRETLNDMSEEYVFSGAVESSFKTFGGRPRQVHLDKPARLVYPAALVQFRSWPAALGIEFAIFAT